MSEDRYVFQVEWYDTTASLIRTYNLIYFLRDKTIEMYDLKNKKIFLKRTEYPSIELKNIFVGATLSIYSRQLKVTNYADQFTANKFELEKGKTFAMIKPDAYMNSGKIINLIEESGFLIKNIKMVKMTQADAQKFYAEHRGKPFFTNLTNFISSDFVIGLELISEQCVQKWRELLGPTDPNTARKQAPNSIRALFGAQGVKNAAHGSDSAASALREIQFFFSKGSSLKTPAHFDNCSCLVVKPHLVKQGYVGQIIDTVLNSRFEISALELFKLDRPSAEQFHEVYKNVVPQYNEMIEELTSGSCVAMEVRQENVIPKLRELCGPHDPEMAKTVRPKSIRAVYGKSKAQNGVHCTDLPEDGQLEVEYFFNILQR